jgi:hypothetical protein
VRQGQRFLRAGLPAILATSPAMLSPRMVRMIEDLAADWHRLDERIECLSWPDEPMPNDMVCTVIEGELEITQGDKKFICKNGEVYSCGKDTHEEATNKGTVPAIMRVIDLLPG